MACCSHPRVDSDSSSSSVCISGLRHVLTELSISFELLRPQDRPSLIGTYLCCCIQLMLRITRFYLHPRQRAARDTRRIRVRHVHVCYLLGRHGSVLRLRIRRVYAVYPLTARYSANPAVSACPRFGICALSDPETSRKSAE